MRFINLKTKAEESFLSHPSVLCIGNFDGVHLGHRQLVASVLKKYEMLKNEYKDLVCGAWLFDSNFYKSSDEIYSIDEKLEVFSSLGLDYAVIADFDEMKSLSPREFVDNILLDECKCLHAVCGENFRFGSKASGDSDMLVRLMLGRATVVPLLSSEDRIISSTYIRTLLNKGDIEKANCLLCRNYSLSEKVVHGKALGRKLGIPTINQYAESKKLILMNGIYSTVCTVDGVKYYGVTNVGVRPTVEKLGDKNAETYMIDFEGDCYGKTVKLEFISRIRDEMKFESVETLKLQIERDIVAVKAYFNII